MNCKPGDLARIIANSKCVFGATQDAIVIVHALPPMDRWGDVALPDGFKSEARNSDWVVEFCTPIVIKRNNGTIRQTRFATCADKYLRPIRDPGDSATDETLVFAGKPQSREVA